MATISALRAQLAELERRLAEARELEARVDELEGQALEVVTLRARNAELEAKLLARESEVEAVEPKATRAKTKQPTSANGESQGDDLKQIRGIGPAFERALNARGVRSFSQIAAWTASELEEIARALRVKPERIRKEDWVGRARTLLDSPEKG
ncbi:MAG TPA: hypothetical protein VG937_15200 [Polyangiaceae bacterium]|nr:hypothetical protein [Polyangiaceae bacterium]